MNLESLANLGEIVGAAAVVASLLYLAVQVRQGTRAQRTENYARALDRLSAVQSALGQDPELSLIYSRGVQDPSRLTALEKIRFTWTAYEAFDAFEFMFQTHQTGELPDEVWRRWSTTIAWWLSFPGVQVWWQHRPAGFTDSFTQYVESVLADNPTDAGVNRRWEAFLADNPGKVPAADRPATGSPQP
ncbi:MAG: hypothetical protein OEY08_13845 [Gammaproteobacteria bacterium]|nr:hypothetical protein [Gammaproteobacteria bacterium]